MEITLSLPMLLFLMLMTGFAGFVDSAAGGGGLISLPAYLFAGLPVHYTYGTNKFSAACGTTFATAQFFQKGAMNIRVGLLAAVGSFVGSALGSHIVLLLSDQVLRTMMLIILPVAAVLILWRRDLPTRTGRRHPERQKGGAGPCHRAGHRPVRRHLWPGTGTFAIIAFTTLMGFDLRTAGGNAQGAQPCQQLRQPGNVSFQRAGGVLHWHPLCHQRHCGQPAGLPLRPQEGRKVPFAP